MIESTKLTDIELKNYAENHIRYEHEMLLWSARILAFLGKVKVRGFIAWTIKNALLNTFGIHARNLTLFLYPGNSKQPTDVAIDNYISSTDLINNLTPISKNLEKVKEKANKQVAHLTTNRIEYEKKGKEWEFLKIANEIKTIFAKIASCIPGEKISNEFKRTLADVKFESPIIEAKIVENQKEIPIGLEIKIESEVKKY